MFRKILGIVVSLVLVSGASLPLASSVHAGAPPLAPSVVWSSPPSAYYGGWPLSLSVSVNNPMRSELVYSASFWFNWEPLHLESESRPYVGMSGASWQNIRTVFHTCDPTGCLVTLTGTIQSNDRTWAMFRSLTGNSLGTFTLASAQVKFFDSAQVSSEARITLVEVPTPLSITIEAENSYPVTGGERSIIVRATDRTLNDFQLLGIGTSCSDAIVDDYARWTQTNVTFAQWWARVYLPDGKQCEVTVLVKTRTTTLSQRKTIG